MADLLQASYIWRETKCLDEADMSKRSHPLHLQSTMPQSVPVLGSWASQQVSLGCSNKPQGECTTACICLLDCASGRLVRMRMNVRTCPVRDLMIGRLRHTRFLPLVPQRREPGVQLPCTCLHIRSSAHVKITTEEHASPQALFVSSIHFVRVAWLPRHGHVSLHESM